MFSKYVWNISSVACMLFFSQISIRIKHMINAGSCHNILHIMATACVCESGHKNNIFFSTSCASHKGDSQSANKKHSWLYIEQPILSIRTTMSKVTLRLIESVKFELVRMQCGMATNNFIRFHIFRLFMNEMSEKVTKHLAMFSFRLVVKCKFNVKLVYYWFFLENVFKGKISSTTTSQVVQWTSELNIWYAVIAFRSMFVDRINMLI